MSRLAMVLCAAALAGCAATIRTSETVAESTAGRRVRDSAGNSYDVTLLRGDDRSDLVLRKRDPHGRLSWERRAAGGAPSSGGHALTLDGAGNVVVVWTVTGVGERLADVRVDRYDADGRLLATKTWDGGNGADFGDGVTVRPDGVVVVSGRSYAGAGRFVRWAIPLPCDGSLELAPEVEVAAR